MSKFDITEMSDIDALAWTTRTSGVDPKKFKDVKKMIDKRARSRQREYFIQSNVTLPKLKFLEGKE